MTDEKLKHLLDFDPATIKLLFETTEKTMAGILDNIRQDIGLCPKCMANIMIQVLEHIEHDMESNDVRH